MACSLQHTCPGRLPGVKPTGCVALLYVPDGFEHFSRVGTIGANDAEYPERLKVKSLIAEKPRFTSRLDYAHQVAAYAFP